MPTAAINSVTTCKSRFSNYKVKCIKFYKITVSVSKLTLKCNMMLKVSEQHWQRLYDRLLFMIKTHKRYSVILYLISGRHKSIQPLRRRAAVRGWFDSPILMRLMANLPLPAPFTDHVRFSWKEHTAASVLTCKHLNVTLCQCRCLRACLYKLYVSQGEGMSVSVL